MALLSVCSESKSPLLWSEKPGVQHSRCPPPRGSSPHTALSTLPPLPTPTTPPHSPGVGSLFTPEGHSPEECCTSEESQPPVNWPPLSLGSCSCLPPGAIYGASEPPRECNSLPWGQLAPKVLYNLVIAPRKRAGLQGTAGAPDGPTIWHLGRCTQGHLPPGAPAQAAVAMPFLLHVRCEKRVIKTTFRNCREG